MNPVETYEHAGVPVAIHYDEDPQHADPRDGDCNLGGMVTFHRDYTFGRGEQDISNAGSPDLFFRAPCTRCEETGWVKDYEGSGCVPDEDGDVMCPDCGGDQYIELSPETYFKREHGARVVLKLGLIDHSGLSMYVGGGPHVMDSAGWDSGTIGFIFDSAEGRKTCGVEDWMDEQLTEGLGSEVEVFDQFLRGEVYGFVVGDEERDEYDSCWGFLGDLEYVKQEANSAAEGIAADRMKEAREASYWAACDVVTA